MGWRHCPFLCARNAFSVWLGLSAVDMRLGVFSRPSPLAYCCAIDFFPSNLIQLGSFLGANTSQSNLSTPVCSRERKRSILARVGVSALPLFRWRSRLLFSQSEMSNAKAIGSTTLAVACHCARQRKRRRTRRGGSLHHGARRLHPPHPAHPRDRARHRQASRQSIRLTDSRADRQSFLSLARRTR